VIMARKSDPKKDGSDELLWETVAAGITPLRQRKRRVAPIDRVTPVAKPTAVALKPKRRSPPVVLPAKPATPPPQPELSHGAIAGLDRRSVKRLKKGDVTIDARIDLHGSTQSDAHHRLERFIRDCHDNDYRLVLVITGKGLRQDGGVGILREAVPRWLGEAPNRSKILGYSYAAPKDGAQGALYVRLKRKGNR